MINLKNRNDEKCFMCSVFRHIYNCKDKHSDEIRDLKQYENDPNFKGKDFPVKTKGIKKFEQQNPNLLGINVFSINHQNKIYPLRLNDLDCQNSTDLFLHENTHPKPMGLTEENKEDFKQATVCYICENPFTENDKKVTIVISQENIEEQHTTNAIFIVEDIIWPFLIY